MFRLKSGVWPTLGLKLAILATFLKISTSNLFCPVFTLVIKIDRQTKLEVNRTPKSHINGHISIRVFSKVSVTKSLINKFKLISLKMWPK